MKAAEAKQKEDNDEKRRAQRKADRGINGTFQRANTKSGNEYFGTGQRKEVAKGQKVPSGVQRKLQLDNTGKNQVKMKVNASFVRRLLTKIGISALSERDALM